MASCSGICGITIDCGSNGCGVFCTSDCVDCTQWCEPTTLPADSGQPPPPVLVRIVRHADGPRVHVQFGTDAAAMTAAKPRYDADAPFRVCLNDISRAGLAGLLGHVLGRTVRAQEGKGAEKLSGSATGTLAEIAARYALVAE